MKVAVVSNNIDLSFLFCAFAHFTLSQNKKEVGNTVRIAFVGRNTQSVPPPLPQLEGQRIIKANLRRPA